MLHWKVTHIANGTDDLLVYIGNILDVLKIITVN